MSSKLNHLTKPIRLLVFFREHESPNPLYRDLAAISDKWWETSIPMCDRQRLEVKTQTLEENEHWKARLLNGVH